MCTRPMPRYMHTCAYVNGRHWRHRRYISGHRCVNGHRYVAYTCVIQISWRLVVCSALPLSVVMYVCGIYVCDTDIYTCDICIAPGYTCDIQYTCDIPAHHTVYHTYIPISVSHRDLRVISRPGYTCGIPARAGPHRYSFQPIVGEDLDIYILMYIYTYIYIYSYIYAFYT
jgi:hypothetical protein